MSDGAMHVGGLPDPARASQEDWDTGHRDLWVGENGEVIQTHGRDRCAGDPCPLHAPSAHHMVTWPLRLVRLSTWPAERGCPHGHWHPDPDDQHWRVKSLRRLPRVCVGCDGCCEVDGE